MKNLLILSACALLITGCDDGSSSAPRSNFEYSGAYGNGLTSTQIAAAEARFKSGADRRAAGETLQSTIAAANRPTSPTASTSYCSTGWYRGADGNCQFAGATSTPLKTSNQWATSNKRPPEPFESPCFSNRNVMASPTTGRLIETTSNPNNCRDRTLETRCNRPQPQADNQGPSFIFS